MSDPSGNKETMNQGLAQWNQKLKPTSIKRNALISVLIIALAIFAKVALDKFVEKPETKKEPNKLRAVIAEVAQLQDLQLVVNAQGEARPGTVINLVPQVDGKIVSVSDSFTDGGAFTAGETLIQIDDSDYKINVIRARASVAQAEQALVRERAEGEIARKDWEELGTGEATALTLRKPQLQQAKALLLAAQAELQQAELMLERTQVKAPFSGRVMQQNADLGEYVGPASILGRIFSTDTTRISLALTDDELAKLDLPIAFVAEDAESAPSVKLSATMGGKTRVWEGKIMRTDSTFDPQTRAMYAIAEVFDPYGAGAADGQFPLAPGLFVDAEIGGYDLKQVIVLSRDGLRPENKVFVVDEYGKATERQATVIDTNANRAILSAGVEPGEMVILSPMERSQLNARFKVLDSKDPSIVLVDPQPETENSEANETDSEADKK